MASYNGRFNGLAVFKPKTMNLDTSWIIMDSHACTAVQRETPNRQSHRGHFTNRKCSSKGIGRQGIAPKHRNCLQNEPTPCRPTLTIAQLGTELYMLPSYSESAESI